MLAASRELNKYFHDCKDVLNRILEKKNSMSDELGRDAGSVHTLLRKHQIFLQDLQTLQSQVEQIKDESRKLQESYAGDKAKEITNREAEVVNAWDGLQQDCENRRLKLGDTGDLFRFFNMVRMLMLWMDDVIRQMNTSEKPRLVLTISFNFVVSILQVLTSLTIRWGYSICEKLSCGGEYLIQVQKLLEPAREKMTPAHYLHFNFICSFDFSHLTTLIMKIWRAYDFEVHVGYEKYMLKI